MPRMSLLQIVALALGAGTVFLSPTSGRATGEDLPVAQHALGVGLGIRGDAVREDLIVPLTFSGPGARILFLYRASVGPGLLTARADIGLAVLFNRFGHLAATLDYGAEVAWTARFFRGMGWHLSLGPALAFDSRVNYIYSWDDAHGYWLGSQWLGPMLRHARRLSNSWRLESSASLAVLGFEGRPPAYRYNKQEALTHVDYYFTQPQRSERFVTLADLQVLRIDVAVRRTVYSSSEVGRGWAFGLDLRFAQTDVVATNINLGVCLYAARSWGW